MRIEFGILITNNGRAGSDNTATFDYSKEQGHELTINQKSLISQLDGYTLLLAENSITV